MTTKKIFAVSLIAMAAVSSAHAVIVSESMLSKTSGVYDKDSTVQMAIADAKAAGTSAATAAAAAQATANAAVVANTTAMTAGTYPKVTVDSKGLVTAGSNLSASDRTLHGAGP